MKLPSLTQETSWAWSGDPALDAPVRKTGEAKKAWDARVTEWQRRLDVARQTGQWDGLLKPGATLTLFTVGYVPKLVFTRFEDEHRNGVLGVAEAMATAVQLGLRSVSNLDDFDGKAFKVEQRHHEKWGAIADAAVLDLLDAYYRHAKQADSTVADPVYELGAFIISRQRGVPPLSERG